MVESRRRASKSSIKSWSTNTLIVMLSDDDRAILEFEGRWWLEPGAKDPAIEFTLGLSAAAYYERLLGIVEGEAAARFDPLTVARVRSVVERFPVEEVVS